jgi:hypothetical protein
MDIAITTSIVIGNTGIAIVATGGHGGTGTTTQDTTHTSTVMEDITVRADT